VIDRESTIYPKIVLFQNTLKWAEVLYLCFYVILVFWFLYTGFCGESCSDVSFSVELLDIFAFLIFAGWGILSSVRTGLTFLLDDDDDEPETVFYVSLGGLALSYVIFGLFFDDFIKSIFGDFTSSSVILASVVTLLATVVGFLADKRTWDKVSTFVKLRITLSLLLIISLIISPVFGVILSALFIPISILLSDKKDV
jgi:hypothetical protein